VSVTILLLAILAVVAGWWLSRQRLMAKPWLEEGPLGEFPGTGASPVPAAKLGLGVFLAVISSLFALFISAYVMRMHMAGDWKPVPEPGLLWVNTAVLIASSVALQRAHAAAERRDLAALKTGLLVGGLAVLAFLAGQLLVWRQLNDAGFYLAANPANSFFYLITAVHGLHMLGGVVALGRTSARVWRNGEPDEIGPSLGLCALYWHFLLVVWLVLFCLLLLT
jgi:cytochrome c oxidase subunit 3